MKPRPIRPLYGRKILATAKDFRRVLRPAQTVAMTLAGIIRACNRTGEPNAAEAQRLADEVREFRQAFRHGRDVASLVKRALMIGAAFERLRANVLWSKPARAGLGTMANRGRNAGDHSALIEWARRKIAAGAKPRGLAAEAKRQRKTKLTERQARKVLQGAGIMPRQNRN